MFFLSLHPNMKYLRWLLFPFSLLYGLVVIIRNFCYDAGIFTSRKFKKPIISIGNLDVGGAGKSPMTEYLIRLLKGEYKLATLSRGYGRKTKGYFEAGPSIERQESRTKGLEAGDEISPDVPAVSGVSGVSPVSETPADNNHSRLATHYSPLTTHLPIAIGTPLSTKIGDEPAQFKHKFPDITVAVCEKRVEGIRRLIPNHDLILLDDAYQHRAVEPGLSILLFDYNRVNEPHLLLPAGNLREPFSGRWRAQIIIVTKCPAMLTDDEQAALGLKIKPLPYQQLFFTTISYQQLQGLDGAPVDFTIDKETTVFLLTGIANAKPLVQHLNGYTSQIIHHKYPDHHPFTLKNITKLADEFLACASQKKIIITTEKDAQRLEESWVKQVMPDLGKLPVFVIPIQVVFLTESGQSFNQLIFEYVRQHPAFHSIH